MSKIPRRRSTGTLEQIDWVTLIEQSKVDMIRTDDSRDVNYNDDTDSDTDSDDGIQNIRNKNRNSSQCLSGNESDESDFHPKLFGLLDNPGVMRFDCLDYPLAVTEDSDEEYHKKGDTANHWKRVSFDDLTNIFGGKLSNFNIEAKICSKSLYDIPNSYRAICKIV